MMNTRATRKDVAREANVSEAVVSYVTNDSNYVSEQKRKLVNDAIEKLGYNPNYFARTLKTKRSYNLSLIASFINNENFLEVFSELENEAFVREFHISVFNEESSKSAFSSSRSDGLIIISDNYSEDELNELANFNDAIVLVSNLCYQKLNKNITSVKIDFGDSVISLVKHFVSKGYQKVLYVTNTKSYELVENNEKFLCAERCSRQLNLKCSPYMLDSVNLEYLSLFIKKIHTNCPIALLVENDALALRIIGCADKMSISIPEDIAVASFDNIKYSEYCNPSLTTIGYNKRKLAETIMNSLLNLISKNDVFDQSIESSLIIRESV